MHISDNVHRNGNEVAFDGRPFIQADVTKLPFSDGAADFVIVSHLAEHVDDPSAFCAELHRAYDRGYIETPSPVRPDFPIAMDRQGLSGINPTLSAPDPFTSLTR
jgi:SAM-dependent methyltransferase